MLFINNELFLLIFYRQAFLAVRWAFLLAIGRVEKPAWNERIRTSVRFESLIDSRKRFHFESVAFGQLSPDACLSKFFRDIYRDVGNRSVGVSQLHSLMCFHRIFSLILTDFVIFRTLQWYEKLLISGFPFNPICGDLNN